MPVGIGTAKRLTEADKSYMLSAREGGRSYRFIADVLGVSSETIMHHLCAKRRSKKAERNRIYKASHHEQTEKRMKEHPNYVRDNRRVKELSTNGGKVRGLNKRPYPLDHKCELCNNETTLLKYHHWNPTNLSIGMWLCEGCHRVAEVLELINLPSLRSKYIELKERAGTDVIIAKLNAKMEGLRGA